MNFLFFLFCFLNLYGPLSTNITFVFNVMFFLYVFSVSKSFTIEMGWYRTISFILLLLSIFALLTTRDPKTDYTVVGTYLRLLVTCLTFPSIIFFFLKKKVAVINVLSLTLFMHCVAVLLQMANPSLEEYNSILFRYERNDVELIDYTYRHLGLAGGYDLAGLYAVLSTVMALEIYLVTLKRFYFIIFLISFVASLFTSRTGMSVCLISCVLCLFINKMGLMRKFSITGLFVFGAVILVAIYFILPIILPAFDISYGSTAINVEGQYSERTSYYLYNDHLEPLAYLNVKELLLGYGCGVRNTNKLMAGSDIGYIKQIYQVGLVGVFLIVFFCYKCAKSTNTRYKKYRNIPNMILGRQLMWLLFAIYLIFNCKNHLMYAVCSFEVFLMVYWITFYYSEVQRLREKVII